MARAPEPELILVPLPEVLRRLGLACTKAFDRNWRDVFTPRRADGTTRSKRSPRVVLSDELDAAVAHGPAAVLTVRRAKGRLKDKEAA